MDIYGIKIKFFEICGVEIFNFIFRIGVILAVYNFLWWLIMLGIKLLRGGRLQYEFEIYFFKAIRYAFLADVIYLFTVHQSDGFYNLNDFFIAGLIMLLYFIGRIQKKQDKQQFFSVRGQMNIPGLNDMLKQIKPIFNIYLEIAVVALALGLYILFYYEPTWASNTIANWFLDSILNIEDTPVFGFIFKVVGFFFLLSVLSKVFGSIMMVLTGQASRSHDNYYEEEEDDDEFDDYTEIN